MGWASRYIKKLLARESVSFRPHGHSMTGRIESGQLCTVVRSILGRWKLVISCCARLPATSTCTSSRAIENGRYQIGNNRGLINGWVGSEHIYGKCVKVEP
jgi:hypothetical protein